VELLCRENVKLSDAQYDLTTAMPLPKLSPLQSRLAASLIASIMLFLLYFAFSFPHFAYAADVDSIRPDDHNHDRLLATPFLDLDFGELDLREASFEYEAEFLGVDRGIIGRATTDPTVLTNNERSTTNINQGQLVSYKFTNASLWGSKSTTDTGFPSQISLQGRSTYGGASGWGGMEEDAEWEVEDGPELKLLRRQSSSENRTLYVTVSTCTQPSPISNTSTDTAPQLQLYVSTSQNNTNPGPGQSPQDVVNLVEGYGLYALNATSTTTDVYIGVYGVNQNTTFSGVWNAEIAASIDQPFHTYWNNSPSNLYTVDTDDRSVLLFTGPFMTNSSSNTTVFQEWMDLNPPPYTLFASDPTNTALEGLSHSFCGLSNYASIAESRTGQAVSTVVTGMTSIGANLLPRQQFYMNGLSAGTTYTGYLAMNGNSTSSASGIVGGGGQVFRAMTFSTISGMCDWKS
jgi:calcium channel MID1